MQHTEVMSIIESLHAQEAEMHEKIKALNHAMFKHAVEFPTYRELYCFVHTQAKSLDDFNISMLYCRDEWFKKRV